MFTTGRATLSLKGGKGQGNLQTTGGVCQCDVEGAGDLLATIVAVMDANFAQLISWSMRALIPLCVRLSVGSTKVLML